MCTEWRHCRRIVIVDGFRGYNDARVCVSILCQSVCKCCYTENCCSFLTPKKIFRYQFWKNILSLTLRCYRWTVYCSMSVHVKLILGHVIVDNDSLWVLVLICNSDYQMLHSCMMNWIYKFLIDEVTLAIIRCHHWCCRFLTILLLLFLFYFYFFLLCLLLGLQRIPNFRIRPDPDPAGSFTIGSGRIRIFTGSRAFGCGRIRIFTGLGSGCNLIQDQSWIALNEDISASVQKKKIDIFLNLLCCWKWLTTCNYHC